MLVTLIVTTYDLNRYDDTIEAIDSLLSQTYGEKEIIVVVDRNEALFLKLAAVLSPEIKTVLSRGGGLSNSRNAGVEHATGEIVAFMDDDAVADKNWLSILVQNYSAPEVIGAGGRINPLWLGNEENSFPEELFWIIGCTYKGYPESRSVIRNNFGGNISFRRTVFSHVTFNADVGRNGSVQLTSDETEFSIKLAERFPELKIIYDPDAIVYHRIYPYRLSLKYILHRAYGDGLSKAYISVKHAGGSLSTENNYLKCLLAKSMPRELRTALTGKIQGVT